MDTMSLPTRSLSRRTLLRGGALAGGLIALGCKSSRTVPTCTDTAGLTPEELQARAALGYEDRCGDPAKACDHCVQWVDAPSDGACGGCKVLKGPICPVGTCKAFAAKG